MEKLKELREEIDRIDMVILKNIADRRNVVKEIGALKEDEGIPIVNLGREEEHLKDLVEQGERMQVPEKEVRDIFNRIMLAGRETQEENK